MHRNSVSVVPHNCVCFLFQELIKMATSQQEKDDLSEAVESMRDVIKYVNNILHQVSITGFHVCISSLAEWFIFIN